MGWSCFLGGHVDKETTMQSAMSACSLMQGQMSLIFIFVFSMVHRTGMKLSVNGEKCSLL